MPEISLTANDVSQTIYLRFLKLEPAGVAQGVDENTPGLELWYRRAGGDRVTFAPVGLGSLKSPYTPGGIEPIDDGYCRVDLPNAAIVAGADNVQVGGSATGIVAIGVFVKLKPPRAVSESPHDTSSTSLVDCRAMLPETVSTNVDGCQLVTKRRHISMPKGLCGTAVWTMRTASGLAANLSDCVMMESVSESEMDMEPSGFIKVRFMGCDRGCILAEVDAEIVNTANGLIQFQVPEAVCQNAGIYAFQAALFNNGQPVFMDSGLISVEHGMWGNTGNMLGPPTIEDIRFLLRDRADENTLLGVVEFDDAEILNAVSLPIREFNECPPQLRQYNCNDFPWRYNWMNAIVGHLLRMAAAHYMRNKLQMAGPDLTVDSKNKDDAYLRFAQMYREEWQLFIREKKCQLNARLAWGSIR